MSRSVAQPTSDQLADGQAIVRVTNAILLLDTNQLENREIVRTTLGTRQLKQDIARLTTRYDTASLVAFAYERCSELKGVLSESGRRAAAAWLYLKSKKGKATLAAHINELKPKHE